MFETTEGLIIILYTNTHTQIKIIRICLIVCVCLVLPNDPHVSHLLLTVLMLSWCI